MRKTRILSLTAVVGIITMATPLFAADGTADSQIQQMTVKVKELETEDERNAATSELGQAEALIAKARSIVGERSERDELARTLEESEATLSLAEAKIIEADKQAALDEQGAALAKVEADLKSTRLEVDELEAEQAKLDAKLGGGK